MSNTGARPDQIEKAAEAEWRARGGVALKRWDELCDEAKAGCYEEMHEHACYLCPVGSAILDAEDVAAIRRVAKMAAAFIDAPQVVVDFSGPGAVKVGMAFEQATNAVRINNDLDRLRRIGGEG